MEHDNEYVRQSYSSRQARDFERIFKVKLSDYWLGPMFGFDVTEFDDDVVKSGNQSPRAAIQQTYGSEAVKLVEELLRVK
jgi:hypothetical protein